MKKTQTHNVPLILICVDGLGWNYVLKNSCYFWMVHGKPIQDIQPTLTCPNWSTLLTGELPKKHRVLDNTIKEDKTFLLKTPTIFDWYTTKYPEEKPVVYYSWDSLVKLIPNTKTKKVWERNTVCKFTDYFMKKKPHFSLVFIKQLDETGHMHGWGSEKYNRCVRKIYKDVMEMVLEFQKKNLPFQMILIADHGGKGFSHVQGGKDISTIPFVYYTNADVSLPRSPRNIRDVYGIMKEILRGIRGKPRKKEKGKKKTYLSR
jgi:predicted AlkP superfamily pyrophosphatase or phosphodiesterase